MPDRRWFDFDIAIFETIENINSEIITFIILKRNILFYHLAELRWHEIILDM